MATRTTKYIVDQMLCFNGIYSSQLLNQNFLTLLWRLNDWMMVTWVLRSEIVDWIMKAADEWEKQTKQRRKSQATASPRRQRRRRRRRQRRRVEATGARWLMIRECSGKREEKKIDEKTLHRPGEDSPLFLKLLRSNLSFDDLASEIENNNYKLGLNVFVTLEFWHKK